MIQRISLLSLFLFTLNISFAQQDPMFTKYMFNTLAYNPAYAGSKEYLSAVALYRNQWINIDGAPISQTLTLHSPLGERMALGGSLINDKIGVSGFTNLNLMYAYRIPFVVGKLSIGIQAGAINWRADWDKLNYKDARSDDQSFSDIDENQWLTKFGAGIYYAYDRFYCGVSVPNLVNTNLGRIDSQNTGQIDLKSKLYRHYYFMMGSAHPFAGGKFVLKPSLLVKSVGLFGVFNSEGTQLKKEATPTEIDIDLSILIMKKVWFGLSFRTSIEKYVNGKSSIDSADAWMSYLFESGLRLGVAYDYTLTQLKDYNSGSIEAMVGFDFDFKKSHLNTPRYF